VVRRKKSYTGERLTAGLHLKCTPTERHKIEAAAAKRGMRLKRL
jgi:hypothetical protein